MWGPAEGLQGTDVLCELKGMQGGTHLIIYFLQGSG